jgi:enoyl-CoA hydratase/carnithine racemase
MSGLVEVRRHGSVCVIALRREAKLNALSTELERALDRALELAERLAVALTKQAIGAAEDSPREAGLLIERLAYALLAQTERG